MKFDAPEFPVLDQNLINQRRDAERQQQAVQHSIVARMEADMGHFGHGLKKHKVHFKFITMQNLHFGLDEFISLFLFSTVIFSLICLEKIRFPGVPGEQQLAGAPAITQCRGFPGEQQLADAPAGARFPAVARCAAEDE